MSEIFQIMLGLGDKLAAHVLLSASAIALGIAVALPLAVWAGHSRTVARASLGFASLVQTIPALALLALFFPILLSLRAVFGEDLPTLGFLPALLALSLYALLPILRNTVTAREQMGAEVLEAADGVGMTAWQKLRLVEAPLAAPYIMAGIRTAAVWTIGAATLSTTVGQPGLGDPIFAGLQTQNWALVLAGCFASAGLALIADALLGAVERGFASRRKWLVWSGALLALAGVGAAAWNERELAGDDDKIVIAAKTFSEQYILARLIGGQLEEAGFAVEYRDGMGSAVVHNALTTDEVDIYVDYTGTLWTNMLKRDDNPGREAIYDELVRWERETSGTLVLGRLGFENAYALAMRQDRATELGIKTMADLAREAPRLTIGGDVEFFRRPEWISVRDAYGLNFGDNRNYTTTFMYNALTGGEADVISAYSSDGRIAADRLVVLDDPKGAFPAYDALVLVSPETSRDARLIEALQPLIGAIDVEQMRRANLSVDREGDKRSPEQAARELAQEIGL